MTRAALLLSAVWVAAGCAITPPPAWEQPPPPVRDAPVVPEGALHRAEIDNGMELLVLEDARLPRVTLGVSVRRGGGVVAPARAGLAEYTAELMSRGAGERDALALASATDDVGASLSVGSDWDSTTVRVSGLSRDLDRLLEVLADVVLRPRFDRGEARKTRDELLAALERSKDDPGSLAGLYAMRTLYSDHPYGARVAGTPETVARLQAADAQEFHYRIFVPNDAIFFAAGDIEMDALLAKVGEAFGAWERRETVPVGPPPPHPTPEARRIVIVDRPDLTQARILIAQDGLARTDPERIAASLASNVLGGGGFASRLMDSLRAEAGLTYSADSGFHLRRHPGPFVVSTFTEVGQVRRALDITLAEIARLRAEPPDEVELRDAKALVVGRFAMGLETSAAVVGSLVDLAIYGLPEDSLDTFRGRVRAITTEDTARIAREHMHPERAAIILVGPAETLAAQVEDLGPVEIVQP